MVTSVTIEPTPVLLYGSRFWRNTVLFSSKYACRMLAQLFSTCRWWHVL